MDESALDACQRITQRFGARFYDASRFLPKPQRQAAWAVYAFCRVTDNLADEPLTQRKTHFARWRDAVNQALNDSPSNLVLDAFTRAMHAFSIPKNLPLALLDGVAKDLAFTGFDTLSELEHYAYQVASVPGLMMARVLGAPPDADAYAVTLGLAMQLTNIVRDVTDDAALGRVYLPENLLAESGLSCDDVLRDPASPNLVPVLSALRQRARDLYAAAGPGLALVSASSRACAAACLSGYAKILDAPPFPLAQTF